MTRILLILLFTNTILFAQNSKMIETKNGNFSIIDEGTGTPVLLLHGFPDTKELWKNQIPALVNSGFRVIVPDLRGYGNSPSPLEKEKYSMPILMSDVVEILNSLKLGKVHLIGHDWGAGLSWSLVKYVKDRFLSLTVLSVGAPGNSAWSSIEQRQKSWYFYLFLQEGLAEKTLADNDWEFAREFMASHPNREQIIDHFKQGDNLTTALNWYRGNLQDQLSQPNVDYTPVNEKPSKIKEKIEIPVLGIWSEFDNYLTEALMKKSTEHANNFTYKKIKGAGHWGPVIGPH